MTSLPECRGIIPCRYASTRFPGKPLAKIGDMPMFWHVYHRASRCPELSSVTIATDDPRIEAAANALNVPVIMTRADHPSGTDRVLEAAMKLNIADNAVVVNIQGDEPALHPEMISRLTRPFEDPGVCVTTLARPIDARSAENPDQVKVVLDCNNDALYFSRARIPHPRENSKEGEKARFLGHIGLYAFRMDTLKQFVTLPMGRLEQIEKLEQLRLLENRIPIRVVETRLTSFGVDRPEDIEKVRPLIEKPVLHQGTSASQNH